jgi:hypothetical protein
LFAEPFSETMLVRARTRERRMSFSRFQAWLKPCLGSLEQTGNRPAVPLDPLAGTHSAAEHNAEQNAERRTGHASDMRSGTLII